MARNNSSVLCVLLLGHTLVCIFQLPWLFFSCSHLNYQHWCSPCLWMPDSFDPAPCAGIEELALAHRGDKNMVEERSKASILLSNSG